MPNDEERFWSESSEQREESRKRQFRADFGQFYAISCRGRGDLGGLGGRRGGIVPPEMGVNGRVLGQFLAFFGKK